VEIDPEAQQRFQSFLCPPSPASEVDSVKLIEDLASLQALASRSNITSVSFSSARADQPLLAALAVARNLKELRLSGNRFFSPAELEEDDVEEDAAEEAPNNDQPAFTQEDVDNCLVMADDEDHDRPTQALQSIRPDVLISFPRLLPSFRALANLQLDENNLGDDAITALVSGYLDYAPSANRLQSLSLRLNAIGDRGAAAIGELLRISCSLTDLDLSENAIGDDGYVGLCSGILDRTRRRHRQYSALRKLLLYSNGSSTKAADYRGARAIARLLRDAPPDLESVDFGFSVTGMCFTCYSPIFSASL